MEERILLAHGSGGKLSHELVEKVFVHQFSNPALNALDDSGVLEFPGAAASSISSAKDGQLAFTTDSYVVVPLFWPGGDIGRLAVCGTVNDLSMVGARPLYLSAGFIIEEGLPLATLVKVAASMAGAARESGISISTGDTKVVEKGGADKLFINTAGIGYIPNSRRITGSGAEPGDAIIISGYIGDHGIAVMAQREDLPFKTTVCSDVAPLNHLVATMLEASDQIHVLRDPTRGGVATVLKEIALKSNVAMMIYEDRLPIRQQVAAACEMLGYDPLYVANEGKLIASVSSQDVDKVLAAMRRTRYGEDSTIIGEVLPQPQSKVLMRTRVGGTRIVDMLVGEMLPRIC